MSVKADEAAKGNLAARLGFKQGQIVQEFGWDEDVDEQLRAEIHELLGEEMLDETEHTVADVVVLWWRSDDGDLADGLVDVISSLDDKGFVWLFTPKRDESDHVDPADVAEGAETSGLVTSSSQAVGERWSATRLAPAGARRG